MGRRRIRTWYNKKKDSVRNFVIQKILHADDPPHRLALGVAIGMFITFTPTIGLQMLLIVFFCWLFRANKLVGVPLAWISNPATIVPIFYFCYIVGLAILGQEAVSGEWWEQLTDFPEDQGWWNTVKFFWNKFLEIAWPLWLGSIVVAGVIAIISYYMTYFAIYGYRMKYWGQLTRPEREQSDKDVPSVPRSDTP